MSTRTTIMIALVIALFLVIPGVSADYPWRNPNYHTPTPTELPLPSPVPTLIQSCQPDPVIGSVSQYHYSVMVLDGINQSQIRMALQYIPNIFSFELVEDDPMQYTFKDGYAVPQTPRLITVFNGSMHGYMYPSAMGYHYWQGRSTVVYLGQDPYPLSWIITHECLHEPLHNTTINQDNLQSFAPLWNEWMQERDVGYWSGDERQHVSRGWSRLQQDFLVSQCLTR